MACKLTCPNCETVLKEEGDIGKSARGEYRVYDSLVNFKHTAGKFRLILCCVCEHMATVSEFDPM